MKSLTKEQIKQILPQADPLLLVDTASVTEGESASASVYIDPEWDIFRGHFPAKPVLPGIYITESMAQTADLVLLTIPGNEDKCPMFLGIQKMRFLRTVYPGDTLQCTAKITCDAGKGIYDCQVTASCSGKKTAFGIITLALKSGA